MDDKRLLLVENYEVNLELTETASNGGFVARGEFARTDFPTGNKRVYPGKLYEREIHRMGKDMKSRKVYGELDHPNDGKTKLQRVSHLVTNLYKEGDRVLGESEILDTENGRTLKTIIKSGGKVGISSRGFGSVKEDKGGNMVVQDDFKLMTFDFVATPADETAYPQYSKEDVEAVPEKEILNAVENEDIPEDKEVVVEDETKEPDKSEDSVLETKKTEEVKESEDTKEDVEEVMVSEESEKSEKNNTKEEEAPMSNEKNDAVESRESIKDSVAKEIVEKVVEQRDTIKAELLKEPEVANSIKVFSEVRDIMSPYFIDRDVQVIIDDKDKTISELNDKVSEYENTLEELAGLSKQASYELFIEKKLGNDSRKAVIKGLIDDYASFDNLQDLGAKIDTILEGIPVVKEENKDKVQSEELENKVSDLESKLEEKDAENEKLSEQVNDLNVSLDESVDLAKKFGIRAYTEEKLNGHSDRVRLRNIIDKANVDTTEQVDALVDSYTINTSDGAQMVEKIKEHVGHQAETISESNGTEPNGKMSNGEVLGSSFSELRELAGLNNPQSSKKEIN